MTTHGIHHVTAIAGDPQTNVDFYVGVLGLRLVKRTVNFDDPTRYHLYYGDGLGRPGTALTFFAWDTRNVRGRAGTGQVTTIGLSVPEGSLPFWGRRLSERGIDAGGPHRRFDGEPYLSFDDPDGLHLELVATGDDDRPGFADGTMPMAQAIRGLHSVALSLPSPEATAAVLTGALGFRLVADDAGRRRYEAGAGGPGNLVDLVSSDLGPGTTGIGTNHHVAWRVADDASQKALRGRLVDDGYDISEVLDRTYFRSIYFDEPGGVLFEVATDAPGFDVDEEPSTLGTDLKLPAQHEARRAEIEAGLKPIEVPNA